MDKHAQWSVGWNYLSLPKRQQCSHCALLKFGNGCVIYTTLNNGSNYLPMLGFKFILVKVSLVKLPIFSMIFMALVAIIQLTKRKWSKHAKILVDPLRRFSRNSLDNPSKKSTTEIVSILIDLQQHLCTAFPTHGYNCGVCNKNKPMILEAKLFLFRHYRIHMSSLVHTLREPPLVSFYLYVESIFI